MSLRLGREQGKSLVHRDQGIGIGKGNAVCIG
jgi:hypothetical protein